MSQTSIPRRDFLYGLVEGESPSRRGHWQSCVRCCSTRMSLFTCIEQ